jgi:hypothetical protein
VEKVNEGVQEGFILLLDILGWKGAWQRQGEQDPLENLQKIISMAEMLCQRFKVFFDKELPDNKAEYKVISISDTVAIVATPISKGVRGDGFSFADLTLISSIIIRYSILHNIPMRGAISYGRFSVSGNAFIGPAVDEVAAWYEASDWIGVIACPSIIFNESIWTRNESDGYGLFYFEYLAPIKSRSMNLLVVNWVSMWELDLNDYFDELKIGLDKIPGLDRFAKDEPSLLSKFLEMGPIIPDIFSKYYNTRIFYKIAKNIAEESRAALSNNEGE